MAGKARSARSAKERPEASSHDRILQAARRSFATDGYENTTTSAISRRAGTSESQLIKHFGSKEGLLAAIFDEAWQRLEGGLRQARERFDTPLDKLRAVSDLMIGALAADAELRTIMLLEGRRIRRHGHMVLLTGGFLQMVAIVDRLLAELRRGGRLREGLHLQAARSALIGALEGMLRDHLLAERGDYPARYGDGEMRAAFQAVLDGFLVR